MEIAGLMLDALAAVLVFSFIFWNIRGDANDGE
jgi:hypothetical protein